MVLISKMFNVPFLSLFSPTHVSGWTPVKFLDQFKWNIIDLSDLKVKEKQI